MRSVSMIGGALLIRESQDLGSSCDDRTKEPHSIYGRFRGPETGFRLKEIASQSLFKRTSNLNSNWKPPRNIRRFETLGNGSTRARR